LANFLKFESAATSSVEAVKGALATKSVSAVATSSAPSLKLDFTLSSPFATTQEEVSEQDQFGEFNSGSTTSPTTDFTFEAEFPTPEKVVKPLTETLKDLIDQERVEEAMQCKENLKVPSTKLLLFLSNTFQTQEQIDALEQKYNSAKFASKMQEAFEIRNNMERLKVMLQPQEAISRWNTFGNAKDISLSEMRARIEQKVSRAKADAFDAQFNHGTLISLANNDLKAAIALKKQAKQTMESILSEAPKPVVASPTSVVSEETKKMHAKYAQNWQRGLDLCLTEFEKAQEFVKALETKAEEDSSIKERALKNDKVIQYPLIYLMLVSLHTISYLKGLTEVYRVASRLKTAVDHYQEYLSASASPFTTLFLVDRIDNSWNSLCAGMDNSLSLNFVAPTEWNDGKICSYCLLPVTSDPSLTHNSHLWHSSCANFWQHHNSALE
jgi:hypothetical protein